MANTKIPAELSSTPGIIDNSNATAITIDSSENVGIGTGSPTRTFEVNSGTANAAARFESTDSRALIEFKDNAGTASIGNIGTNLTFFPDNANEAMRIDSSGNLLVGKTSAAGQSSAGIEVRGDGVLIATKAGTVQYLNRTGSDGAILNFAKDGTTAGSIENFNSVEFGLVSEKNLILTQKTTTERNLVFSSGYFGTFTADDATTDLGRNVGRFRNLYLSGGVRLGGTGSANELDDYEEGSWTGTLTGSTSAPSTAITATGTYTKVGNLVTVVILFSNTNSTGVSGNIKVTGLPFTAIAGGLGSAWHSRSNTGTGTNNGVMSYLASNNDLLIVNALGQTITWVSTGTGTYAQYTITYQV